MWQDAIDGAAKLGVDAVIVADMGVADYAARSYPDLRLHLSVQAGASSPEAIRFYCEQFGVKRVVLPRMLTVAEIAELHSQIPCEIEAFIFGNIGMMAEGRCYLSNYVTGASTNMDGVCSPAADVHYEEDAARNLTTRLGDYVIDRFAGGESAGYPTICKGRYLCGAQDAPYYAFEEPVSLNLSALLPDLMRAGVTALKIEGRQRSRAYVKSVVGAFRKAVDDIMAGREAAFASLLGAHRRPPRDRRRLPQQAMEMSVQANKSELTLGPLLFNWQPEAWRDFYFRIADEAPVTTVYLGEVDLFQARAAVRRLSRRGGCAAHRRRQDRGALDARRGDVEAGTQDDRRGLRRRRRHGRGERRLRAAAPARAAASRRPLRQCL